MNKFNELYNIILEDLTQALSDEQMNELKSETTDFLNSIKDNEKLKETNIIPSELTAKEELSNNISDTLLFGSNKNIKDRFIKIIEPLNLNLPENIIDNLVIILTKHKKDYTKLVSFLQNKNTVGIELPNMLTLSDISTKTGLSTAILKDIFNLTGKKNGAEIGTGEILLALVLKDGRLADEKGDVEVNNIRLELKTGKSKISEQAMKGPVILKLIREYIQTKYLTKDTQLLSEFYDNTFFNISNLNKSNGLIDLLKKQLKTNNIDDIVLDVLSYGLSKNFDIDFNNEIQNNKDSLLNDGKINIDVLKKIILRLVFTKYMDDNHFKYLVHYNRDKQTFRFFDVSSKTIIDELLTLKLHWPTYGTKNDISDASVCIEK